jgi:hypothetical protein
MFAPVAPNPIAADMIALSQAASLAHEKLFAGTIMTSEDAFDAIATALSRHLPFMACRV